MMENLSRRINQLSDKGDARNLYLLLEPLFQRMRSVALNSAAMAISATTTLAKNGSISHYIAEGIKGRIAADTDMPALSGTITVNTFNVFVFSVDKAGTIYTQIGVEAATEATMKWPVLDQRRAVIGAVVVNPTSANFVGGTTALSASGVNTAYLSPIGAFDPNVTI